jgi:nitroreductase
VVPCIRGRTDRADVYEQASQWGSIIPATWSFMLAARARGLGTTWTTWHLKYEREAAQILGIPYDEVMQAALIPVAHTLGTDFKPTKRKPVEAVVRWNQW